ncbi:MAG: phytochelatin synthase [Desulfobacteraceae bacterium]|nr:phytochelatin synthase [Desulfobacteraceae bacterium]
MILLKYFIRSYLFLRYYFHRISRTGSFSPRHDCRYLTGPYKNAGNPVKDGLHRYHVKQFHESSCSVATVASAVNTLARRQGLNSHEHFPLSQQDLLNTVTAAHWKERMGVNGYNGRRGLPLEVLGEVVRESLEVHGIAHKSVEIFRTPGPSSPAAAGSQQGLRERLVAFETRGDCLVLTHFDQGSFIREMNIPHISPVGGYDPVADRVKILDVDPSQPHPYEIPFRVFYRGIFTRYQNVFRKFGYGRGGCIFIWL